ncbi:peptide/nickel transport system substrate-binding protein/oligopeptide transport system substrate-binding protein [Azospirillum brasilense]|uniref:Peptide/nickel transport system substrate-binding protein/oligopeptide transport system substrate-binding protein n=1 Tax=Azospirillum brasilense TaxID=192 RepID=A0A560C5Z6_AZOBR|nr:ABC transporter substrate-binding protein [Azospirillum brasilense]TWA80264.1 peptide/nickel transport system substrate-binding protein/oligopeptide transport system substrate-binding protein [Azospirillum brasilense]
MPLPAPLRLLLTALAIVAGVAGPAFSAAAGTLRASLSDDLTTIDPFAFPGLISSGVLRQVYEGFTAIDAAGNAVPALATQWETPDGGRTWRFTLRPDVRFHSGRPFTAADVLWTWEQHLTRKPQPGYSAFYLRGVEGAAALQQGTAAALSGVAIPGPHTLVVRLTKPDALFPLYPFLFVDRGMADEFGPAWHERTSGGTGPFRLTSWRRGESVRLEAHAGYWDGAPVVDAVSLAVLPDTNTMLARYDAGELDVAPLPDNAVRTVVRQPRYDGQVAAFARAQVRYLALNQDLYPPFRDRRVREAVGLALDRVATVNGLHAGRALLTNGFVTPGLGSYQPDAPPPPPADPGRAKALLAEAGHAGGRGLPPLQIAGGPNVREEATYFAAQLTAVLGIPVGVRIQERAAFVAAINEGREALFINGWTADFPDPMDQLASQWHSASPTNRTHWRNPDFDRLMERARGLADPAARNALYRDAEALLREQAVALPLPVPQFVALVRPGVSGLVIRPDGTTDYHAARLP